jgi:hypothetical protein
MNPDSKTSGSKKFSGKHVAFLGVAIACLLFFTIPSLNVVSAIFRARELSSEVSRTQEHIESVQGTLEVVKADAATQKNFEAQGHAKKKWKC